MKKKRWIASLAAASAALWLLQRYGRHSGATWEEYQQPLPGDNVVPHPDLEITNAISI